MLQQELPAVSVVVTCYDQARFIGDAVDSILAQTYPAREVVVVDDGSPRPDAAEVVGNYPSVRLIRQDNAGVGPARNTGLHATTAETVVFLDGDDRLLPHALETGARALAAHPACGFVSGHCRLIDAEGRLLGDSEHPCVEEDHYAALLRHAWIHPPGVVTFRRTAIEEAGGWTTEKRMIEDFDMYLRIARNHPIRCHHETVVDYRQHAANSSKNLGRLLRWIIVALRDERALVAGDPRLVAACKEGERYWRTKIGTWLLWQVKGQLRSPTQWPKAATGLTVVARRAPRLLAAKAARKLGR